MNDAIQIAEELALRFEGKAIKMKNGSYQSYFDKLGKKWTIYAGCTGPEISAGTIWSIEKCEEEFHKLVEVAFNQACHIFPNLHKATPNQQAAITDIVFNMGYGTVAYHLPELRRAIEEGYWHHAALMIKNYTKDASGNVDAGLVKRREAESRLMVS